MPTYYIDPVNGADANDGLGWWKIAYSGGHTAAPGVGVTVTGAGGATGIIMSVVLSSGTWAGNNAAGTFYLYGRNATAFANGEAITWTGGSATNAQGTPFNAVYASFKTVKKTFAAGDTINVAKSPETAAAGTVTGTAGSVSVATTNDLTAVCPVYTIIRIGGDNTLYMVKAISSSAITLYRPYRGGTAAGKGLTYFTGLPTSAASDWAPVAMVGTLANPITVQAGMNPADLTQDGFTVLYGNNATYCFGNGSQWTYTNISRVATLYWTKPWASNLTDCILTNNFAFRSATSIGYAATWIRVTTVGFVSVMSFWQIGIVTYDCTLGGIETAESATHGWMANQLTCNCLVTGWRNAGYSGQNSIYMGVGPIENIVFHDAILDELASGCPNIYVQNITNLRVSFLNPTLGSGAAITPNGTFLQCGIIEMTGVGGSLTDNRTYVFHNEATKYTLLSYDGVTYNTAPASAKVTMYQSARNTVFTHLIPCDAGVLKTVSVYLCKNSSYGSVNRPTMRLRWITGSAGALVSNVHDTVMADTNDTFLQVSYAVTPSVTGAIIMELIFQSPTAGAIAWYDDIGVA